MDEKLAAILAQALGQTQNQVQANSVLAGKDNVSHTVLAVRYEKTNPSEGNDPQPYYTMSLEITGASFGEQQKDFNFPVFRDSDTNPFNKLARLHREVYDRLKKDNADVTKEEVLAAMVDEMNSKWGGVKGKNLEWDTLLKINPETEKPYGRYIPWDRETGKAAFYGNDGLPRTSNIIRTFSPAWESESAAWNRATRGTHWVNAQQLSDATNITPPTPNEDELTGGDSNDEPPEPPTGP